MMSSGESRLYDLHFEKPSCIEFQQLTNKDKESIWKWIKHEIEISQKGDTKMNNNEWINKAQASLDIREVLMKCNKNVPRFSLE